jgi:hypothetical protein
MAKLTAAVSTPSLLDNQACGYRQKMLARAAAARRCYGNPHRAARLDHRRLTVSKPPRTKRSWWWSPPDFKDPRLTTMGL